MHVLTAFATVAARRSFRKAAAELGLSTSALSHAIRGLEERLGVRLLNRTTRSVALTDAGERLLEGIEPALAGIRASLEAVSLSGNALTGTVRINAPKLAAATVLPPAIQTFAAHHPGVEVDVAVDNRLVDIVADRFDIGVRFGDALQKDMVAVGVGPPVSLAVVGSPAYLDAHPPISHPEDLVNHACIGLRFRGRGERYSWEFEQAGRAIEVAVAGPVTTDDPELAVDLAVRGIGLAYTALGYVEPLIASRQLRQVLPEWCVTDRFYLYFPSRRNLAPAVRAFIDAAKQQA